MAHRTIPSEVWSELSLMALWFEDGFDSWEMGPVSPSDVWAAYRWWSSRQEG